MQNIKASLDTAKGSTLDHFLIIEHFHFLSFSRAPVCGPPYCNYVNLDKHSQVFYLFHVEAHGTP